TAAPPCSPSPGPAHHAPAHHATALTEHAVIAPARTASPWSVPVPPVAPAAPGSPAPVQAPVSPEGPVAVPAPCASSSGTSTAHSLAGGGNASADLGPAVPAASAGTATASTLAAVASVVDSDDDPGSRPD
ncbi:hypothetical protein NH342_15085, partial [Klenkia sp. PcliD-1-E]|nr:hypothetical protein [Klenkia sp. PcliD-1-E]